MVEVLSEIDQWWEVKFLRETIIISGYIKEIST